MEEITGFSMKGSISAPGLGWNYFNSLRTEEDEPIYTYNHKYKRHFARQSFKSGRLCAFKQYYKTEISNEVLKILYRELKARRNVYDNIEAYMKYKRDHLKFIKAE